MTINRQDFDELISEGKPVETNCRFCGRKYVFPTAELIAAREASESAKDKEEN